MIRTTLCAMAALCIGFFTQVNAENETTTCFRSNVDGKKLTAFYITNPDYDYEDHNYADAYFEGHNAHLSISSIFDRISIQITSPKENFNLDFSAPKNQTLKTGIYKNVKQFHQNENRPGFSLYGNYRDQ